MVKLGLPSIYIGCTQIQSFIEKNCLQNDNFFAKMKNEGWQSHQAPFPFKLIAPEGVRREGTDFRVRGSK